MVSSQILNAPQPSRSFPVLDIARLLSIVSIVWLHTPESRQLQWTAEIGRFAVPFFTFASIFLAFSLAQRRPEMSYREYATSRFYRIYLVFLAWSLVYSLVRIASSIVLKSPFPEIKLPDILWNGSAHHLWFLPFIFVVSILSFSIARLTASLQRGYWPIAGTLSLTGLWFALIHSPNSVRGYGAVVEYSADALPSVLGAVALSMIYVRTPNTTFNQAPVSITGLILWLGCLAILLNGGRTILLETLSGFGLMIVALNRSEWKPLEKIAPWGTYALGIYILHILFLDGFQDICRKFGRSQQWQIDILTFVVTLFCCVVTLRLFRNHPKISKLMF